MGAQHLLIFDGLMKCGEEAFAREVAERFCRMVKDNGFAENFDALTGAGRRDLAYTWTPSVFLIFANEYLKEESEAGGDKIGAVQTCERMKRDNPYEKEQVI